MTRALNWAQVATLNTRDRPRLIVDDLDVAGIKLRVSADLGIQQKLEQGMSREQLQSLLPEADCPRVKGCI